MCHGDFIEICLFFVSFFIFYNLGDNKKTSSLSPSKKPVEIKKKSLNKTIDFDKRIEEAIRKVLSLILISHFFK